MSTIIFDIETGPLPQEQFQHILDKVEAPGNLKDPAKIEAAIKEKQAEIIERAPLSAMTGQILAIGFYDGENYMIASDVSEEAIIMTFWDHVSENNLSVCGHNIKNFDIPFIVRRGYVYGIRPKMQYLEKFSRLVIDTMELFAGGEWGHKASLNDISRLFGLGEKTGSGDQFHKWWNGGERDKAIEYLKKDLELTYKVAERMGVNLHGGS